MPGHRQRETQDRGPCHCAAIARPILLLMPPCELAGGSIRGVAGAFLRLNPTRILSFKDHANSSHGVSEVWPLMRFRQALPRCAAPAIASLVDSPRDFFSLGHLLPLRPYGCGTHCDWPFIIRSLVGLTT